MKRIANLLIWMTIGGWAYGATFSTFSSRTDFRDESIYFILTTRFYDGDSSNNVHCWDGNNPGDPAWRGDFRGLIERLDYIKALGFTAVWISPVVTNASGYDYHGYHAMDFSTVDKRLESADATFRDVIDAAHARGMKIILDIVLNHTGNFGEEHLCKEFTRDWTADQSDIDECMIPYTQSAGGPLPDNYTSMAGSAQYSARLSQMKNTTGINLDNHNYWHHYGNFNWDEPNRWFAQIAGDCVDLNTENPAVYNYLIRCYNRFIAMGVDGFRIDTGGHIARLTFNQAFVPAFTQAGIAAQSARGAAATPFYMFAEVCARYNDILYRGQSCLSPFYYTWAENRTYAWDNDSTSWDSIVALEGDGCNTHTNHHSVWQQATDDAGGLSTQPTSQNALLNGNTYHTPDYSQASGLNVIDFQVHWNFNTIDGAWSTATPNNDRYYNDATWNVIYVDSHDYSPDNCQRVRYNKGTAYWAENLDLMFTYRGIPTLYYGSEIEFKKNCVIDDGPNIPLINSGRAYFGGYLTGTVQATDFGEYTASGNVAQTLAHPLAKHIQRLNKIRQAVPALRKGQYSRSGCSGSYAFKRRYTTDGEDSFALVCISGNATFSSLPGGTYVDCITGDRRTIAEGGSLSVTCSGQGNMRVYVLNGPGKIGEDGKFLYGTTPATIPYPTWDGHEEALTADADTPNADSDTIFLPCLSDSTEHVVFFTKPDSWGKKINCYVWDRGNNSAQKCGSWPGKAATHMGNGTYRYTFNEAPGSQWMIIWNDGSNQTNDLVYTDHGLYSGTERSNITCTSVIDHICDESDIILPAQGIFMHHRPTGNKALVNSQICIIRDGKLYDILGKKIY